jgi:hypothetical protein
VVQEARAAVPGRYAEMANLYRLNDMVTVDMDRILTIAAVDKGIRLTYINSEEETITSISSSERNRFFDHWISD